MKLETECTTPASESPNSDQPSSQRSLINPLSLNNKGLTLVEIMIVLVILGGLMAFLLPRVTGGLDKAKVRQARLGLAAIQEQLEMYSADCGDYPSDLGALINDPGGDCATWSGPYINQEKQLKDPWGVDYDYALDGSDYSIKSLGRDKREGGSGFDADIEANEN